MRLIDVDRLYDSLMFAYQNEEIGSMDDVAEIIVSQPTAYDVDKVVEELEASGRKMSESKLPHNHYKAVSVKKAIEIVEKAGAE